MRTNNTRVSHPSKSLLLIAAFIALLAFSARPDDDAPWSFVVLGDSRNGEEIYSKLMKLIAVDPSKPEMIFHTGDVVPTAAGKKNWLNYLKINSIVSIPVYPIPGNHEAILDKKLKKFVSYTKPPEGKTYYSIKHKDAGFVVLNSYERGSEARIGPEQMAWLKKALADLRPQVRVIFAFIHKPLVTRPTYRHSQPLENAGEVKKLLKEGGVKVVFMGHEHRYDSLVENGVTYIVTAGAGAPLYTNGEGGFHHYCRVVVGPDSVTITAIDPEGVARQEVKVPLP